MMSLIDSILIGLAGLALVPALILLAECVLSVIPGRPRDLALLTRSTRAIVIPAHDEELTISRTVEAVLAQCESGDRVVVVADNCGDRTAEVCRGLGVEVVERSDSGRIGKGFALAAGVDWLSASPPQVVVFFDADVVPGPNCVELLVASAAISGRPSQAIYLLSPPVSPALRDVISAFAFAIKNRIRPLGLSRIGFPVQLTGAGMAFPWALLQKLPIASGNIVEDMRMGVDSTLLGSPPQLVPSAYVHGRLPSDSHAALKQRERWEQGHLRTIFNSVPALLVDGVLRFNLPAVALSLDLLVPPLSFLSMATALIAMTSAAGAISGQSPLALWMSAIAIASFFLSFTIAWLRLGRERPPIRVLLAIPLYVAWKIPLYLGAFLRPQRQWIRTRRD